VTTPSESFDVDHVRRNERAKRRMAFVGGGVATALLVLVLAVLLSLDR